MHPAVGDLTLCRMASFRASGDFSEISGREAVSDNSGAIALEPSLRISLFASSITLLTRLMEMS